MLLPTRNEMHTNQLTFIIIENTVNHFQIKQMPTNIIKEKNTTGSKLWGLTVVRDIIKYITRVVIISLKRTRASLTQLFY